MSFQTKNQIDVEELKIYLYPVQLSIERLHVIADPLGGVPTQLLLHVVEAVGEGVDGLHDEAQLGVLLVAGLERLVAWDDTACGERLIILTVFTHHGTLGWNYSQVCRDYI